MPIPSRLTHYLDQHGVAFAVRERTHSRSSAETARTAHVPLHQLAKSVVVEDDTGCVVAAIPADRSVSLRKLSLLLGSEHMRLADENRIAALLADRDRGAAPAPGMAWGIETVVDDELDAIDVLYVEAGDHERLLRMSHDAFQAVTSAARHGQFCGERVH